MRTPDGPRQPSRFTRHALACLTVLIVYASLSPFSGWRNVGLAPLAFLWAPLPPYLTLFDVVANVLGYLPFGALVVFACHPRLRGVAAVALACMAGTLLSGTMEAMQTWLPLRVSSNVDLAANAAGTLTGAVLAAPLTGRMLDQGLMMRLRVVWFRQHAAPVMILIALWPLAQIYPQPLLFGAGDLPRAEWAGIGPVARDAWLDALSGWAPGPARLLMHVATLRTVQAGAWVTGLNVYAVGALASIATRSTAPRLRLLLVLLGAALAARALAAWMQSEGGMLFDWRANGAPQGALGGCIAVVCLSRLRAAWRAALGCVALAVATVLVNLVSRNPYYEAALDGWRQGQYLYFNHLARWLAWLWPYCTLGWFICAREARMLMTDDLSSKRGIRR
jgi:VanZ family protein